jgi:heme/copper-type cytochrome/quinol oxidase subunit 2
MLKLNYMFNFTALFIFLIFVAFIIILFYKIAKLRDKNENTGSGGGYLNDDDTNPNDNQTT